MLDFKLSRARYIGETALNFSIEKGHSQNYGLPMGVIVDIIWYNESGKRPDALVRFSPKSEEFQSWPIPSGGFYAGIIRHMRATRVGNLLIHQSSSNRIMLVKINNP